MVISIDIFRVLGWGFYSLSYIIYNIEVVVKVDKTTRKRPQRKHKDSRGKKEFQKCELKVQKIINALFSCLVIHGHRWRIDRKLGNFLSYLL